MHQQIRSDPRLSPPDVEKLLRVLADADVNVVAVGGGRLEHGGRIVVACHDERGEDQTAQALEVLRGAGYEADLIAAGSNPQGYLHVGAMRNKKGELAREVAAAHEAAGTGYVVEDIAIGVPYTDAHGDLIHPVQIFLETEEAAASAT